MERMSWLSRLTPRAPGGQRAPRRPSPQSPVTADPETCLMAFQNHWAQVLHILERVGASPAADDLSSVRNNTFQMLILLAEDRPGADGARGPILEFVASENLLERLLSWHAQADFSEERKAEQLKLYEMLLSQARQPLLREPPVLRPLLRLLALCSRPASAPLENSLVLLLNQLCVCVAKEPPVLELFFHGAAEQGPADLLIFSLLVPFIHHEGARGQQARDALLLIMALSAGNRRLAQSITDNSYFCPVLATGLSALYSSLPRKLEVRGDDWHCLRREDWIGVSSLVLFMNSLEFCNAVIQVAHPLVRKQLVDYVHDGFLVPVLGPALHKPSLEETIASTAYLELFLRSISAPALLHTFLRFLLLHRHDGRSLLDTLVARLGASSRLCMVSLSLFRTLLGLHCEDVMLQLVLRYLLPCSHLMLSQRRALRDLDIYGRSAAKFLSLIPRCCRPESSAEAPLDRDDARTHAPSSPVPDAPSSVAAPKPSTPSRLSLFLRPSSSVPEAPTPAPRSPGTPSGSPSRRAAPWEEVSELERNYLEYLRDARRAVDRCALACRVWSAPYDGDDPGDAALPAPPSPALRTKKRGLPDEAARQREAPGSTMAVSEPRDSALVNGEHAAVPAEADVAVKKVRRSGDAEPRAEHQVDANGSVPDWESPVPASDLLLDELLARAPSEPGSAGGTVEAFTAELHELEARLANGAAEPPPRPPPEPPARDDEDDGVAEAEERPALTSPRAVGPPPGQPCTGPFLAALLGKLENLPHNSLYVNFLLTGLVAQLATYPQPLLRSFLLNTNMVFQPSVKSLLQVLGSVKNKIESFAATQEDFPVLLFKAKKFLIARGKLDWAEAAGTVPALRRTDTPGRSRKPSLGELLLRRAPSPPGPPRSPLRGDPRAAPPAAAATALRVRNAVYGAVVFCEFLKELAALAQAHAVTSPFLGEPPEE
ncbi:FHF complex subunit HOOK-interacting protein 1B-like [Phaenicophaeus curvirostris]|uniref:FHF complex subunit HOOK-interacting protein 1B-like n=1 Tax=Phaenicophaeus curvirostris TaxID=33595 RepID=UPI0037F0B2DD